MNSLKPAICIAFEGTISEGTLSTYEGYQLHASVEGAMDALQELSWKYRIVICTSSPSHKLSEINDWIIRNKGARGFVFELTNIRPPAVYYIEKRGIKFESWDQVMNLLGG
jgi:hypothetical protein